MKPYTHWNETNVSKLKAMFAEGKTTATVAQAFGTSVMASERQRSALGITAPRSSWDDERIAKASRLWREGKSGAEVAKSLGGLTASAVIGKMHRLGVAHANREKASSPKASGAQRRKLLGAPKAPAAKKLTRQARDSVKPPKPVGDRPAVVFGPGVHIGPQSAKLIAERVEAPGLATILTVGGHMCRWPIGDPASESFTFCGGKKTSTAYCEAHARVAYQPQQTSKRNSTSELARSLRRYA